MLFTGNQLGPEEDRTIWHFTDGVGLLGILKSRAIWASSVAFLNDSAELNEIFRVIRRLSSENDLGEEQLACLDFALGRAGAGESGQFIALISGGAYVASFSTDCADLSQWRSYSVGRGGSYCIGFSPEYLLEASAPLGFELKKVAYTYAEQKLIVRESLDTFMAKVALMEIRTATILEQAGEWPLHGVPPELPIAIDEFASSIRALSPLIKNSAFEGEKEIRLVRSGHGERSYIEYRATDTGIVPYVPIVFPDEELHLRALIVGPSPRSEHNFAAASMAVAGEGIRCSGCTKAGIPYRSW